MQRLAFGCVFIGVLGLLSVAATAAAAPTPTSPSSLATLSIQSGSVDSVALCPASYTARDACVAHADARGTAAALKVIERAKARRLSHVVLFLPGFSTRFSQGVGWSENIQRGLGADFGVVYVDWGTHGSKAEYEADARSAKSSAPAFAHFIEALHAADPNLTLDVYAHSMGCRVATNTIAALKSATDRRPYVDETALAAPDVNLGDYQHAIARNPKPFGGVTIYVSRFDKALLLSSFVHLHHRLGQLADWHKPLPLTTVVDASAARRMVGGHGYALYDSAIIGDIRLVFEHKPHADWKRNGILWTFVPPAVSVAKK